MRFSGERLRVLRRFHGYTQRALAELVGTSAATITNYERGRQPDQLALDALSVVLEVQPSCFYEPDLDEFREEQTHFRSRQTTTKGEREKILAHATLFGALMEYLAACVIWPRLRLPTVLATSREDIEMAAERCRSEMEAGIEAPIESMMHFAELAGAVITTLDVPIGEKVDAFSRFGDTNMIVLNPARSSVARTRFDVAHEVGHGILHRNGVASHSLKEKEDEADFFARALLMPRDAFTREYWSLGRSPGWPQLVEFKTRWGAPLREIVSRAFDLKLVDAAEYKRRFKYLSKSHWLRIDAVEPGEPPAEAPQLFELGFRRFEEETGKAPATMARELNWTDELFAKIGGVSVPITTITLLPANVTSFEAFKQRRLASG